MKYVEGVSSPFGGAVELVEMVKAGWIIQEYRDKTGVDVSNYFVGIEAVGFYRCKKTDFRYWSPDSLAGKEEFYAALSDWSSDYYRQNRWEYKIAKKYVKSCDVLEVGCGRGYFLKQIEKLANSALGLELNNDAIQHKVTAFEAQRKDVHKVAESNLQFDVVCSFQVLEHIAEPLSFLTSCRDLTKPGGRLIVSTPNYAHTEARLRKDCLDLPPHHMGHYSPSTYRELAKILDMELEAIHLQRRVATAQVVSPDNRGNLLWRLLNKLGCLINQLGFMAIGEVGHTVVAVFRKN